MNFEIIKGLLQNIAILLSFSLLYDYWWVKNESAKKIREKILLGIILGGIGIILMLTPWTLSPGIVFDSRSVMLAISGLFFGPIPTILAILISGAYRYSIGGDGMLMGISVIISSGMIGLLWNVLRPNWRNTYIKDLLMVSLFVHLSMLACTLLLPSSIMITTIKNISLPLIFIYTPGTLVLGVLMIKRSKNWKTRTALSESEEKYRLLYEGMTDAHVIVNLEGQIIECNSAYKDMLGYTDQEIKSMTYFDLTPPKWKTFEEIIIQEQVLVNGASEVYEKEYIHKNGNIFPVELRVFAINDKAGKSDHIWAIIRDISERKKSEAELIRAKEQAENSDRLKTIFLANMSHEVRTPMNAIIGFSELLSNATLSGEDKEEFIQIIRNSSIRLLRIIDDILDISRIDSNQLTILPKDVKLYDVYTESLTTFQKSEHLLQNTEVKLLSHFPSHLKNQIIKTDAFRLQQVMDNLINNATKYTNKGTIEVGVNLINDKETKLIEFYVKDTGVGIPLNMQKLIFERFRQVEETEFHQGTGLGLSISKGLIELLGGSIHVESEPGKGSCFYIRIPYQQGNEIKLQPKRSIDFTALLNNKTIIIAEDEMSSFLYLKELFRNVSATIIQAKNGQLLMDMLKETTPDLILLDINMPVKSGMECLHEIRELNIDTKIIVQTAYAMPDEKENYLKAGCHGYVSKPISRKELHKVINRALNPE
ncbi:MAG: PAS domain S-box protein [Bacteroidales bacterium]|nr:PAS domain S-box protein [Bacteroidales bacterium]